MNKIVKITEHVRANGSIVEAHERAVSVNVEQSLTEKIKSLSKQKQQSVLLFSFTEDK